MKNKIMYTLIVLVALLALWTLYSFVSVRNIEEPKYEVLSVNDGYEIRVYKPIIIAETTIVGATDRNDAARKGFPIVAGYIFGNNTKKDNIAMTVPVNTEETTSEKIAMTVPVNTEKIAMTVPVNTEKIEMTVPVNTEREEGQGSYKVSFVLPSKYTLETLPTPNDSRVSIKEIPSRKIAVRRFSWSASESTILQNEQSLLSSLKRDNVKTVGSVNVARYNTPWTIPFMLRTEVQVVVD